MFTSISLNPCNPVVGRHCLHFIEEETEAERVSDLLQFTSHDLLEPELLAPGASVPPAIWPQCPGRGSPSCMGVRFGVLRGPGSPSAGLGAPVSASCLCWAHLLIHPTYPRAALCRVSHCGTSGHYGWFLGCHHPGIWASLVPVSLLFPSPG